MERDDRIAQGDAGETGDGRDGLPAPLALQRTLFERLRSYFVAGLLIAAPLAMTLSIVSWAIELVDTRLIPRPLSIPGAGVVAVIIGLTAIGWLASSVAGRLVHNTGERLLARIPVVRGVYAALKQIFEAVFAQQSTAFREVVLVEYPRRGLWSLGFLTGRTTGEVQRVTADDVVNVFLPTTPNPTSGFLLFVPREDIVPLRMSVEDGLKMVVSGGIVTPGEPGRGAGPPPRPGGHPAQRRA